MFSPIHYGYYEAYMQTSLAAGTVNSMFMFSSQPVSSDGNEIDIEILSQENDISHHTGLVHFTVFLPQGRKVTATVPLPFAPWAGLHKYGFNWTPDGIVWYIDQQPASITTCATSVVTPSAETLVSNPSCFAGAQNVPQFPGLLIVNHWTNGQSWSGPAPSADAAMTVYNVVLSPLKR